MALKLLGAGSAWAQRRGSSVATASVIVEAVVTDQDGNIVRNLSPVDFVVSEDGHRRTIASFAAVDAVSGATRATPPLPLPLKIDPGELHRSFVLVVDDAGISAPAAKGLREALQRFVDQQIGAHDSVAILRTSAGAGPMEQITSDRIALRAAIAQIAFNPAASPPSVPGWPQMLGYVLQGLRLIAGRKAVAVFTSGDLPNACIFDSAIAAANRSWTSIYLVHPTGIRYPPLCAAGELAAGTAGLDLGLDPSTALARIAHDQESYYLLGFERVTEITMRDPQVTIQVSRPGLQVRSRRQPPGTSPPDFQFAPGSVQNELRRLMSNPFDPGSMRINVSAAFSHTLVYQVTATLLIDGRDITFTHRLNGTHEAAVDVLVRVYDTAGKMLYDETAPAAISATTAADCDRIREEGVTVRVPIPVRTPGVLQIYAAVRDGTSSNSGIAHKLIEVPDVSKGNLLLSGLSLMPANAADADPTRRAFRPGQQFIYECAVYNAKSGDDKAAQLEVRTIMFAGEKVVYSGNAIALTVPDAAKRQWLVLRGKLDLASNIAQGEFILQVSVTDKVSGRSASQWTDFTLR